MMKRSSSDMYWATVGTPICVRDACSHEAKPAYLQSWIPRALETPPTRELVLGTWPLTWQLSTRGHAVMSR